MNPADWGPAEWAAFAAVAGLVVAMSVGLWQVLESRDLRKEQSRPFVIVDFEFRNILVYLQISNIGTTIARDVEIKFDKPLTTTLGRPAEVDESPLFERPIPMMAPGRRISILFDSFIGRAGRDDMPMVYQVSLTYRDAHGRTFEDPPYPLDLGIYTASAIERKGLPELVDEVGKVGKELAKWTKRP